MTYHVNDSSIRVLICDKVDEMLPEGLSGEGYQVDYRPGISREELIETIGRYDVAVVRSRTKIDSAVIEAGKQLKIIARAGIGIDNIDSESAKSRGVKIITAAGSSTNSVVELNVALAINVARKIPSLYANLKEGKFQKQLGRELHGKTAGIIGFGRIGYQTAKVLSSLGMKVIAYDIVENEAMMRDVGGRYIALGDLLRDSDFIFVSVTLNGGSKELIGEKQLSLMKKGVAIVNTSRAEAINGEDLVESIKNGIVGGYASDVMWNEPPKEKWEMELLNMENVVITPHIGAQTAEAQKRVALTTLENIVKTVKELR